MPEVILMPKKQKFFTTTQPEEWQAAFRKEATRKGKTLSEWVGETLVAALPANARKSLPARPAANRPKKAE
jgi:hypothetical protein